ncbi:MAG: hypothetical protein KatS3mg027_1048 [Bacteroidia bacterium]|nr:MAG: hypothetical protein KatS3mg027_1048 [Bacteroidia bacterium]
MDYFYVGNHINSVGLIDGYLKLNFGKGNWNIFVNVHNFQAAADIKDVKKIYTHSICSYEQTVGARIRSNVFV